MFPNKRKRLNESEKKADSPEELMQKLTMESELRTIKRPGLPDIVKAYPTYRAVLSRKGYLVHQTLGSGTYSKVKVATCPIGGFADHVAIKIVDHHRAPKDYQERFLPRELEIWPKLKHPHIVRLFDHFRDERREYMILEFAPRGDVLRYIQNHGAMKESSARKWTLQLCDAVRYMHKRDIAHRDLKLENLLIDAYGNIKLCDFGFVKSNSSAELSNTYCGSKSYAAPEILQGRPYPPQKADIWALGVILYIIVTGKMPFDESRGTKHIIEQQRQLQIHWPNVRPITFNCKELMMQMFRWHFNDRINIHNVLAHSWFRMPLRHKHQVASTTVSPACQASKPSHPVKRSTST